MAFISPRQDDRTITIYGKRVKSETLVDPKSRFMRLQLFPLSVERNIPPSAPAKNSLKEFGFRLSRLNALSLTDFALSHGER